MTENIQFALNYNMAVQALHAIAEFGHAEDCELKRVPIYECSCVARQKDQWQIAKETLKQIGEL